MSAKTPRTKRDMAERAFRHVAEARHHMAALAEAVSFCNSHRGYSDHDMEKLARQMQTYLYTVECESWRNFAVWGLGLPDKDQERIRAAVHAELRITHRAPMWFEGSEEEYRQLCIDTFVPQDIKDYMTAATTAQRMEG